MRNRIIYNVEGLFIGPTPSTGFSFLDISSATGAGTNFNAAVYGPAPSLFGNGNTGINLINQLYRIQDVSYSFNIPRTDVLQYGELGAIDKVNLEPPTVNLSFSYLLSSFINEKYLGFQLTGLQGATVNSNCLYPFIASTQNDKNYFIKTNPVVVGDANNNTSNLPYTGEVIAIGNGFITNYTSEGAVGSFPKVSVSVEAANIKFDKITAWDKAQFNLQSPDTGTQYIPAVNLTDGTALTSQLYSLPKALTSPSGSTITSVSAFKQGDIRLNLSSLTDGGADITDAKIQSYSLSIPMSRTPINKLGTKYPYTRELNVPITATLTLNAIVGDLVTGTLTEIINNNKQYNLSILLQNSADTNITAFKYPNYFISGAFLDSQNFTSNIGGNKSVTMNFSIPFGQKSQILFSGQYPN